jgi:hypothetical protein
MTELTSQPLAQNLIEKAGGHVENARFNEALIFLQTWWDGFEEFDVPTKEQIDFGLYHFNRGFQKE